ncbi:MAG: hypothetical protein R3C49_23130 [Planctomycetaceae bacterium]
MRRLRLASPTNHRQSRRNGRRGLTLLEVILSTAIFLGSLTAVLQLMNVGHGSRVAAKLQAEAALRCESLMGEYIAGISPLADETQTPFADSEEWVYTTVIEESGFTSLLKITVLVEHLANDQPNAAFELVRLKRDPELFLEAAAAAEASASSSSSGELH